MSATVKTYVWLAVTLGLAAAQQDDLSFSQQLSPIITSISPNFGGVEGGTDIVISGSNFQSGGLFTSHQVYVGGDVCKINDYYTTNERIICKTPKCYSPACLAESTSNYADVEVSVLVATVQGILEDTANFRYHSGYTPFIYKFYSDSTWGGDTSLMYARQQSEFLADLDVKIGAHHANLGDDDELNPDEFSSRWSANIQYRTPDDMEAGYYNVSLTVQSVQSAPGSRGTGLARTFEEAKYDFGTDYYYDFYSYRSSLAGTVHSTTVFPSVRGVSPSSGSIGGGTVLTITGSGFSAESRDLEVFAGGELCDVISSDLTTITCRTRAHRVADDKVALGEMVNATEPVIAKSSRAGGSPGWWVKMWDRNGINANRYEDDNVNRAFGWRERSYLSLYRLSGSGWYNDIAWSSGYTFMMEAATEFTAPYTGYYTFLWSTDDTGYLYASRDGIGENEALIAQSIAWRTDGEYYVEEDQKADPILLEKGERLYLRGRNLNWGGLDQFSLAVEIAPLFDADGKLAASAADVVSYDTADIEALCEDQLPERLLHHNGLKEVQEFQISYDFAREVQLVNITGLSNTAEGEFKLVVQGLILTDKISLSDSNYEIGLSIRRAAEEITTSARECRYFTVTRVNGPTFVELYVRFDEDRESFTGLQLVDYSLQGSHKSTKISVFIPHTPIPTGTFEITFNGKTTAPINYAASSTEVELAMKSLNPADIQVEVFASGFAMDSRLWRVTFIKPGGPQDMIEVDTSGIITGDDKTLTVKRVRPGTDSVLLFDPVPPFMLATPVAWATAGETTSFVEVLKYSDVKGSDRRDVVKSVCAPSAAKDGGRVDYFFNNGDENDCAFAYSTENSAVVMNQKMTYVNDYDVDIVITGRDFDLSNYTGLGGKALNVKVGPKPCNITLFSDSRIECTVGYVPWGEYDVEVFLDGYGFAVVLDADPLTFTQEIHSVSENLGSFVGGQRLVIEGRGFRSFDAEVLIGTEVCEITQASYDRIACIIPRANPEAAYNRRLSTAHKKYKQSKTERVVPKPIVESEEAENERRKHMKNMLNLRDPLKRAKTTQKFANKAKDLRGDGDVHALNLAAHRDNVHYGSYPKRRQEGGDLDSISFEDTHLRMDDYIPVADKSRANLSAKKTEERDREEEELVYPEGAKLLVDASSLHIHSTSGMAPRHKEAVQAPRVYAALDIGSEAYSEMDAFSVYSMTYSTEIDVYSDTGSDYVFSDYSTDYSDYSALYSFEPEPSGLPTAVPTAMPSLGLNFSEVPVSVDGMVADGLYTYSVDATPFLTMISPMMVSRATEVNLTFYGIGLVSDGSGDVEVTFDGETCEVFEMTGESVSCTLPQGVLLDVVDAEVVIYIPNLGYVAKSEDAVLSLPTVESGFQIYSISPQVGSLLGGTTIEITGFGFFSSMGEDYNIKFAVDAVELPSEYNVLSEALGFAVDDSETLYCSVALASFHKIVCNLDKTPKGVVVEDFSVAMGLNGVATACGDAACLFTQSHHVTPMIMAATDVSLNESGYVFFSLDGMLLARDGVIAVHLSKIPMEENMDDSMDHMGHRRLDMMNMDGGMDMDPYMHHETMPDTLDHSGNHLMTLDDIPCWSTVEDDDTVSVICPPVTAGRWNVSAFVASLGWADSNGVTVLTDVEVTEVEIDSTSGFGSIAGGIITTIRGYGFSNDCRENSGQFEVFNDARTETFVATLSHHVSELHHFMDFISCTVTEIIVYTPSIAALIPSSEAELTSSTAYNYEIKAITIMVNAVDDNSDADFKSTFAMTEVFKYSTEYTPTAIVTVASGTKSSAPNYFVNLTCPTMMHGSRSISFSRPADGGRSMSITDCTPVSAIKTGSFMDGGVMQYRAELSCPTPLLPAAVYQVVIAVAHLGRAHWGPHAPMEFVSEFDVRGMLDPMLTDFPNKFPDRYLTVNTVSRIQSSVAGGQVVTISGEGFSDEVAVSMCSQPCVYINSSYDSYQCAAPDRLSIRALQEAEDMLNAMPGVSWGFDDLIKEVSGTPYSSSSSQTGFAFDEGFGTYFSHYTSNCFVGMVAPAGFKIKPHNLHYYPRLQYANTIKGTGAVFEGSLDGGATYITLAEIGLAHEGWNTVAPDESLSNQWFTHLRYREPVRSSSACFIAEIWFEGISASIEDECEVMVSLPLDPSEPAPVNVGTINYNMTEATPMVLSLTPNNGTALGGTTVEITGINLMATAELPTVAFNGIECDVTSASSTSIVCVTRSRLPEAVQPFSIDVNVPGLGYAISPDPHLKFLYIDRWSEATSWRNQQFPKAGDIVWIPEGQVIMLDIFSPQFLFVLVQGHLYFDRERDVSLDSTYIFVYGGYMEVGTAEEPYERNAVITLHGDRFTDIDMPMFGAKCLVVSALGAGTHTHHYNPRPHAPGPDMGQLEVHGLKRMRTWTKLSVTANAGDNFVVTSEPVDFKAGEIVVIPGTELPGGGDPSHPEYGIEVMTVLSNDDNHHVYFTEPLQLTHRSEIVTEEGRVIDLRCEIGLLTRNVVIRGDDRSHGQLFGVHVVGIMQAIFRIENTEVTLCGQAHNLGRYCTHSHVGMNMAGSYVKANSIHHSFQRTVTTHTTHHWEVRDNVGYDIMGHAYFVEFGDETYNHITGNLGILVKPNSAGLKSDHKPAVFWTAIPTNFWSDNVGVHSRAWGFWFELADKKGDQCPFDGHLGEFHNMTFRANSAIGLRIYPGWTPQVDPCGPNTAPAAQYLRNMVSYRNGAFGLFTKKMGDLHHIGHSILENGDNEIHIVKFEHVPYDYNPAFLDILLIGTLNPPSHDDFSVGAFGIHAPQNDFFFIKNVTFKNFGRAAAIGTCNSCESGEKFNQGGVQYRTEQLRFIKSSRRIKWMPHYKEIFRDLDGTLVDGPAESYVVRRYFFNDWPGVCSTMDTDVFDNSVICNKPVRTMRVDEVEPQPLDFTDLRITSAAGSDEVYFLPLHFYGWTIPLVVDQQYSFEWADSQTSAREMRIGFGGQNEYLNEAVDVYHRNESARILYAPYHYDYDAYSFQVTYGGEVTVANVTVDIPKAPKYRMGAASYVNETLKVDFSTFGADRSFGSDTYRIFAEPQLCPPAGCPVPPPYVPPSEFLLWTNVSIWPGSVLPKAGDDVVISADKWVVMDINPPPFKSVTVNGKLSFQKGRGADSNMTLMTGNLAVYGEFQIDFSNRTADGVADVILTGDKDSSDPVLIGEGIFPGSKVIAVPGSLKLVGQKIENTWLRLSETADFGDSSIVLAGQARDWQVGDEIALSPTAYFTRNGDAWYDEDAGDANGMERRTITSISFSNSEDTTTIHFSDPLGATHICITDMGESFCGTAALLSRNVRLSSRDSEDPESSSFGFGGHIMVMDATMEDNSVGRDMTGTANLEYIQLINFGKQNTDHYGIGYYYMSANNRDTPSGKNRVNGCAFDSGYNIAVHTLGTNGFKMDGNVIFGNWAGGVEIDYLAKNTTVTNNVVMGSRQRPSIFAGGYPWTVPMAAFLFESSNILVASGNIAAGSYDEGFGVAIGSLPRFAKGSDAAKAVCGLTRGELYNDPSAYLPSSVAISDSEAVGCRSGYVLLTVPGSTIDLNDCIVVSGVKVWRSGHVGLEGVDMRADILVHDVVLAENPIGTSFSYFKVGADNAFTGLIDSTIIGTFREDGYSDSVDSQLSKQTCQAFSFADPWGLRDNQCGSVINGHYRRVGLLLPQHTNGPKTCATAGRFRCRPANVPDRLCGMPWQKRFGVPVSMLYSEMHIHNVRFIGFRSGDAVPSASYRSVAIAINPSQIDAQSTVIVSGLSWAEPGDSDGTSPRMDEKARIGAEHGDTTCNGHWCMGLEMLLIHDQDGSLGATDDMPTYSGGQISLGGGVMTAPSPMCFSASHLGPSWQLCPSDISDRDDDVFRQYSAVWRDWGSDVIGPVTTTRYFDQGDNRTFASYEPKDDMCALKMSFSRFPLLIASGGRKQRIESTGTIPSMWTLRWDAPSEDDVAILEFWIHEGGNAGSSVINVLTAESSAGPWTKVNKFSDRYPNKNDPAGANTRNPQKRTLTVVLRGGARNWYRFAVQPVVAVTMRMEMSIENFFAENFIVNMATLLKVPISRIAIADVRQGSVIVDFTVEPSTTATEPSEISGQIAELDQINALLNQSLANGNLSSAMNATILDFASAVPDAPVIFDELANFTDFPTAIPTLSPTAVPTFSPTHVPTRRPTLNPTLAPTVFSSEAKTGDDDNTAQIYEEDFFLPAAVGAGVLTLVIVLTLMGYCCGCFGGCCGLFSTGDSKERGSGPQVIVGSGARNRRVSPPEAAKDMAAANTHGGSAVKRVVPTTSGNRMPAHMARNYDNAEAGRSNPEGLFVSNQVEMDRNDSLQNYSSPPKAKPGATGHHHQLSLASETGTSMSFEDRPTDVIRHHDSNTYHLDNPVQDEEVELYFDYGTQL